jgi:putative endonuclease
VTESVKKPAKLKRRVLSKLQQNQHNFSLGNSGELQAADFLENKGYQIFDTNVRVGTSEIDIVALDEKHEELVFIEVKTRSNSYYGNPSTAVNRDKIRSMNFVANIYLKRSHLDYDYRFDIVAITPEGIEHYENVTWG